MKEHYIHTEQLMESRDNVIAAAQPLKTFLSWVLFAPKDRVTSHIAVIEAKGKLVVQETDMKPEDLVCLLVSRLMGSFVNYKPLTKSIKGALLSKLDFCLDRLLSKSMMDQGRSSTPIAHRFSRSSSKDYDSEEPVVIRRRRKKEDIEKPEAEKPWSYADLCE